MLDLYKIIIVSIASFIGSYYGSLVGGGGLLVVPVLLSLGLPVPVALGTRRFSVLGGTTAGFIQFHKWKKINYRISCSLIVFTLIGALLGYICVDSVNELLLKKTIGFLIMVLAIVLFFENTDNVKKIRGRLYNYKSIIGPEYQSISIK